jgi:hypothetical protein
MICFSTVTIPTSGLTLWSIGMSVLAKFWRIWAKALGEKAGKSDKEADRVALIRTLIVLCYIITNIFIVAGVIRHW